MPSGSVEVADRRRRQPSVTQVVAAAISLGATVVGLTFWLADMTDGSFRLDWLEGNALLVVLVMLTCTAELVAVRVRHENDAVEELTLLDGMVLLNTLLLSARGAVLVSLGGVLLAYIMRRRDAIKMVYNLGVYATASTAAALAMHAVGPASGTFDLRLVLAMTAATSAFVAVNLAHMAILLRALSGARPWEVVREDAPLSVMTVIGTVALTGTVLVMSVTAPVLLPCVVLPAAALWYAYGASAAKHEERRRSARVLAYSQVLASGPTRPIALTALLQLVHEEFEAVASLALFEDGSGFDFDATSSRIRPLAGSASHRRLQELSELALLTAMDLPFGWQRAMVAPVTVEGHRVGNIVVATSGRTRLHARDLTTLSPLVGSLAVALQNADQMTRLVEETSKLRAVVDQAGDGIVVLSRQGVVQVWSPAMAGLTAVSAEAAIGARLGDVLTAEYGTDDAMDPFIEGLSRLAPHSPLAAVDVQLVRSDGERRSTRFLHAGAFDGGDLVRDVIIVRDLTAEWQVQRMKSDFIATVSHELRTPLTPIKGYATMLRKRGDAILPEKRNRALDVIVDRAEHLGRLVEDLLAASVITATGEATHTMATDVADLTALVARACADFPAAAQRIRVEAPTEPVQVLCDPTRALQVVGNLISNALKYSQADSEVVVRINESNGQGRLTVADHGHGIPADQLERIFDKFHRVEDPMVMSTGGTGLGLFIARHLARAMNGELVAESTLGQGSRFTMLLPVPLAEGPFGDPVAQFPAT